MSLFLRVKGQPSLCILACVDGGDRMTIPHQLIPMTNLRLQPMAVGLGWAAANSTAAQEENDLNLGPGLLIFRKRVDFWVPACASVK